LSVTVPVEELPPVTLVGLRLSDESVGALAVTVKLLALVAVPPGVVTLIGPVVAPLGTVADIVVAELTEKFALVPLKVTAVAPATVKLAALVAVPPGAVTLSGPVVAPVGTGA